MSENTKIMAGKCGLVTGCANDRSIAFGIAKQLAAQGAELAFTYQTDRLAKRVVPLAEQLGSKIVLPMDVGSSDSIDAAFAEIDKQWDGIDFLVHSIAFSDRDELNGQYLDTSRDNFAATMDVSVYSLIALAQRAAPRMKEGGSIITLSYLGAERVMTNYNVMGVAKAALEASVRYLAVDLGPRGIRVNAISAGPVRTLASAGISNFNVMLRWSEINSPLRRNVSLDEIGNTAMFLLSDMGTGITGETVHVDSGYHAVGMAALEETEALGELLDSIKSNKAV
ncbi:MAG: enoyl-ACP reductase [Pseudomonadota bacterium]|nr:enoyl-ACP reductase [Pseudomonadota bacterium]